MFSLSDTSLPRILFIVTSGCLVLIGLGAVIMRDQIFQSFLDPGVPFQTYTRPPAPDYAQARAWMTRPPERIDGEAGAPAVFFVHPTTYDGGGHWNAPFDLPEQTAELTRIILPNYAAPFLVEDVQLYAPHYRQAALYAFMNNREDSILARLLAHDDVQRAFTWFLQELDETQPFFLVGVDQGGAIALKLLIDQIAPVESVRKRLAAAYIIDAPTPLDLISGPLEAMPVCKNPEDVRCLVSWIAVRPENASRIAVINDRSLALNAQGRIAPLNERALLCVNPLLWTAGEDYAPARLHQGGVAAEGLNLSDSPSPMPNQTGAQCQNGLLMIDRPRMRALRRPGRLGEDRRVRPANLFYMDIQANAADRLNAIRATLADEARYAPALDGLEIIETAPITPIDG